MSNQGGRAGDHQQLDSCIEMAARYRQIQASDA